jgi:hypothetical protein
MTDAIEIRMGKGRLIAVPAVHFRVAFAARVNELCRQIRPGAIAVELGPDMAAAAAQWIRELSDSGRKYNRRLPCMLGLVKSTRCKCFGKHLCMEIQRI